MLQASISFFVLALVAYAVGANGLGSVSLEVGRILLFVFLILSLITFVLSLSSRSSNTKKIK